NRSLKQHAARNRDIKWDQSAVHEATYRPFTKQWAYFDRHVNDMVYQIPAMFPTPHHTNTGFYTLGVGATSDLSLAMSSGLPDVQMLGAGQNGQFFPRWTYETAEAPDGQLDLSSQHGEVDEWGYRRVDNITDEICDLYT